MGGIKELFYNFIVNLIKSSNLNYYLFRDLVSKNNHSSDSTTVRWFYSKKANSQIVSFHYLETPIEIAKINTHRFVRKGVNNHVYCFSYRPFSKSEKKLIEQNLPNIPLISKERILAYMMKTKGSDVLNNAVKRKVTAMMFFSPIRLFHRVNFLSERVDNWTLYSIFLWNSIMNKCNSNTLHQILHICGIYKQGTRYLSVELRFGKDRLTQGLERNKNEESFFLLKNNNKKNYSIIVRVNTTIEKDRLNYKKEMRMLLAETAQNLKYYSSSE